MAARTNTGTYRAKFRGLILHIMGERQVVPCELELELRPTSDRAERYAVFYVKAQIRALERVYALREAKDRAADLFAEQLTDWQEVPPS